MSWIPSCSQPDNLNRYSTCLLGLIPSVRVVMIDGDIWIRGFGAGGLRGGSFRAGGRPLQGGSWGITEVSERTGVKRSTETESCFEPIWTITYFGVWVSILYAPLYSGDSKGNWTSLLGHISWRQRRRWNCRTWYFSRRLLTRRRNRIVSENLLNSSEIFFCRELRTIQELTRKYHEAPNKASEAGTEESS